MNDAVTDVGPDAGLSLISRFIRDLRDIVLRPQVFFARQRSLILSDEGLPSALAFAVIVAWVAALFSFVWSSVFRVFAEQHMADLLHITADVFKMSPGSYSFDLKMPQEIVHFLFGAGAVIITPFWTLFRVLFYAAFVHLAVKLFVTELPDRKISYFSTLKIVAYGFAPLVLEFIPGLGWFLGGLLRLTSTAVGLREVYGTTTGRSTIAVLFPALLGMLLFLLALIFVLLLVLGAFSLVF